MKDDSIRISFRVRGAQLAQLRDVQEIMGLNTPGEAHQYLAQRGLEAISPQLLARKVFKKFEGLANPQEMLPLLAMMSGEAAPTPKLAEKVS